MRPHTREIGVIDRDEAFCHDSTNEARRYVCSVDLYVVFVVFIS